MAEIVICAEIFFLLCQKPVLFSEFHRVAADTLQDTKSDQVQRRVECFKQRFITPSLFTFSLSPSVCLQKPLTFLYFRDL